MKRIDTINVREDLFGSGKAGFHDNADLSGQDATYLSPDWLNTIQEELCNLLELNGVLLNPDSKNQLFQLLVTRLMFAGGEKHFRIPNPLRPDKPWIIQFNQLARTVNSGTNTNYDVSYNIVFPTAVDLLIGVPNNSPAGQQFTVSAEKRTTSTFSLVISSSVTLSNQDFSWLAVGY